MFVITRWGVLTIMGSDYPGVGPGSLCARTPEPGAGRAVSS